MNFLDLPHLISSHGGVRLTAEVGEINGVLLGVSVDGGATRYVGLNAAEARRLAAVLQDMADESESRRAQ